MPALFLRKFDHCLLALVFTFSDDTFIFIKLEIFFGWNEWEIKLNPLLTNCYPCVITGCNKYILMQQLYYGICSSKSVWKSWIRQHPPKQISLEIIYFLFKNPKMIYFFKMLKYLGTFVTWLLLQRYLHTFQLYFFDQ